MTIFRNKFFLIFFGLVLAILAYFSFLVINNEIKHKKYKRNFDLISIGDSEESVISKMGKPKKIKKCYYISSEDNRKEAKEYLEQCENIYSYVSFLEIYDISFDKNNFVRNKNYMVSP